MGVGGGVRVCGQYWPTEIDQQCVGQPMIAHRDINRNNTFLALGFTAHLAQGPRVLGVGHGVVVGGHGSDERVSCFLQPFVSLKEVAEISIRVAQTPSKHLENLVGSVGP